jgi:alpha-glucosidase
VPYVYSLAQRAQSSGEPIFPPLVYHFQDDLTVRENATEKMIGPSLLFRIVVDWRGEGRAQASEAPVYLPKGTWYEFYENSPIVSRGEWVSAHPFWKTGKFQLPLYVREGAVLPLMGETVRHLGKSSGGAEELRIYPSKNGGEFVLREDDGETTAYMAGAIKRTKVSHQSVGSDYVVRIGSSEGTYAGASNGREWKVQVISHRPVSSISWNGNLLAKSNQKIPGGFGSWVQPVGKGPITVYIPRTDDQILKELKVSYAE